MRCEVRVQRLAIARPADVVADGIEVQHDARQPVPAQHFVGQRDDLDIGLGSGKAETLDAELVRLTVAPGLRALVPEERPRVVEPLRAACKQVVFQQRAHDGRRPFRAQGQAAVALVPERVHLFLDDVGRLAHAAHEKIRRLEHRRSNLTVAEPSRDPADSRFEGLPARTVGGKDVCRSPRGGDLAHCDPHLTANVRNASTRTPARVPSGLGRPRAPRPCPADGPRTRSAGFSGRERLRGGTLRARCGRPPPAGGRARAAPGLRLRRTPAGRPQPPRDFSGLDALRPGDRRSQGRGRDGERAGGPACFVLRGAGRLGDTGCAR